MKDYLKLKDITAYSIASKIADEVYAIVSLWNWFDKRTLGAQLVDAIDSIAANIAEGFGRYHKRDKIKFYYNARGSVFESAHWMKKAEQRKLLNKSHLDQLMVALRILPKEINNLIRLTERNLEK